MKMLFQKLVWEKHKTIDNQNYISELDKYADYQFDNGIFVRVNTGQFARANTVCPYEMYIEEPDQTITSVPFLTSINVNIIMNDLNLKTFE